MHDVKQRVREESRRFRAAVPELMKTLAGRWVIFKDGEVQDSFDNDTTAYHEALRRYGIEGGFVLARVEPQEPTPLSASMAMFCR